MAITIEAANQIGSLFRASGADVYFIAVAFAVSGLNVLLMYHCCPIPKIFCMVQYRTRPAGKKKNITEKTSGRINITFACTGSGGAGLSFVWINIDAPMIIGNT